MKATYVSNDALVDPDLPSLVPGDVLAGKYRVERVLGVGGMGGVVAAQHMQLEDRVALKFLRRSFARDERAVRRFLREAQASARVRSEHVVRVLDVGTLENGAPYIVMEYLHGCDLSVMIDTRESIPVAEAVEYVLQACSGVAEAHAVGVIHRDLKPANLFVTRRTEGSPLVKVLDFGISKFVARPDQRELTVTGVVMGSPRYMAPEQIRSGKAVGPEADVWSLGMVLYELLAGQTAFEGDTIPGMLAAVIGDAPEPLDARRPGLDPALVAVVMRCLEKDPARRFPSAAAFARALLPFAPPGCGVSVSRIERLAPYAPADAAPPAPAGADSEADTVVAPAERTQHAVDETAAPLTGGFASRASKGKSSRRLAAFAAAVALLVVAYAVLRARPSAVVETAAPLASSAPLETTLPTAEPPALVPPMPAAPTTASSAPMPVSSAPMAPARRAAPRTQRVTPTTGVAPSNVTPKNVPTDIFERNHG